MPRLFEGVVSLGLLTSLSLSVHADDSVEDTVEASGAASADASADDDDAPATDWYRPVAADSALQPRVAAAAAVKARPPIMFSGQLAFGAYESGSESTLRVRMEQAFSAAFIGAASIGDVTFFEVGAELHTGGIPLMEDQTQKLSLMTPIFGARYLVSTVDEAPSMWALSISGISLRYCRCVSSKRPLVVDFKPSFNVGGGSKDVMDPITGSTTTVDVSFQGLGITLGAGMGF